MSQHPLHDTAIILAPEIPKSKTSSGNMLAFTDILHNKKLFYASEFKNFWILLHKIDFCIISINFWEHILFFWFWYAQCQYNCTTHQPTIDNSNIENDTLLKRMISFPLYFGCSQQQFFWGMCIICLLSIFLRDPCEPPPIPLKSLSPYFLAPLHLRYSSHYKFIVLFFCMILT